MYEQITREASNRCATIAKTVRDHLAEYMALRSELANAIEAPGELGDNHSGKIIHTLLARTEARMALSIDDLQKTIVLSSDEASNALQKIITMISELHLDLMRYFPKMPEELANSAKTTAKVRHNAWLETIQENI